MNSSNAGLPMGVRLPHLAVLEAQGPDAGSFLQGQLTQDVLSMTTKEARAGGYCSAKGRLMANLVIMRLDEQTWRFVTHADLVESLVKRLKMFVLRAKCTVQARPDLVVRGRWAGDLAPWGVRIAGVADSPSSFSSADIGWWGGRCLSIANGSSEGDAAPGSGDEDGAQALRWRHEDILAGWPWIEAATVEQFVPQMVNLELLGGVNFRKGCYPGQEVVARSQYRGTLKRRMALLTLEGEPPTAGTEVFHSEDPGQPAGLVVNAAGVPEAAPPRSVLLVEVKLAAMGSGTLHLGAAQGPKLTLSTLPYRIPAEAEM